MSLTLTPQRLCLMTAACAALVFLFAGTAHAGNFAETAHAYSAVYSGSGLSPSPISGLSSDTSVNSIVTKIINFVLNLVLIFGVLAIVIAGIYLITSNGDEGQKDKAKMIILYVAIGIIVVLMAKVIVLFVNNLL